MKVFYGAEYWTSEESGGQKIEPTTIIFICVAFTMHKTNIYHPNTQYLYHFQCFWLDTSKFTIFMVKFWSNQRKLIDALMLYTPLLLLPSSICFSDWLVHFLRTQPSRKNHCHQGCIKDRNLLVFKKKNLRDCKHISIFLEFFKS